MGPIALFDKSFLQSLNINESVWFDNFYQSNISPLFYIETLADLSKEISRGRTPEQIVGEIASKTPEMSGVPNTYHTELIINNLLGYKVVMDGRPILSGGRLVKKGTQKGMSFDVPAESKAYSRWQEGKYLDIERDFAKFWRNQVESINFEKLKSYFHKLKINTEECKNIEDAYKAASTFVSLNKKPYETLGLIFELFSIPQKFHTTIVKRYQENNLPPLNSFSPYAAYIIKIETFFYICVSRGFISTERPSNKIDIAYLYYLPFCNIFISSDKLHKRVAPLFMRENQEFIQGSDLKMDLNKLNSYYSILPEEIKKKGIISFAKRPPDEDFLTTTLWDKMTPGWRNNPEINTPLPKEGNDKLIQHFEGFTEDNITSDDIESFDFDNLDSLSLKKSIQKKKGDWFQLPSDLKNG